MSDSLIAKSIEYSALGCIDKFELDYSVTLKEVSDLSKLSFKNCKENVVLHKVGGGPLPYKVGDWVSIREIQGNLVSIGVYKKHR
jgi:hypothetical protein